MILFSTDLNDNLLFPVAGHLGAVNGLQDDGGVDHITLRRCTAAHLSSGIKEIPFVMGFVVKAGTNVNFVSSDGEEFC